MLDRATIERALSFSEGAPFLIALSGGGDSLALLHLLADAFGPEALRGAVVDHALREGSAADAGRARGFAEALHVPTQILTLTWPSGSRPSQADARAGRYAALCAEARRIGARVLMLAHTRDDQAETVLMRAARGATWRGLAGMRAVAPAPVWPEGRGLRVARPLLTERRTALRKALAARGASWLEDPANENELFARVRVRRRLAALEASGFDPMRLAALARHLAAHADALDGAAWRLIAAAARFKDDTVEISLTAWRGDAAVRARALSVLIAAAAGAAREPGAEQVAALELRFLADFAGATLGGAALKRRRHAIVITRDRGALEGRADGATPVAPLPLQPRMETVWDGRLALTAPEPGYRVEAADGAPVLVCGEMRAALAGAAPRWLLETYARHRLGID